MPAVLKKSYTQAENMMPNPETRKILFLFSDTGGGHRSAAEAIIEAIDLEYQDQLVCEMVDIFKEYAPPPLQKMPDLYPKMVRIPQVWGMGYNMSNGRLKVKAIAKTAWPYVRNAFIRIAKDHPSDLVVSVHPLANTGMLNAIQGSHIPFITVVTDLVSTHAAWFDPRADLCLVPTEEARQRAIKAKMDPSKVVVVGLPVANRFCQPMGDPIELRRRFGWPRNNTTVLLVGGGEGMGPIEKTAEAIATAKLPITLIVITGRNQKLQEQLERKAAQWPIPVFVYGFVHEMPGFMQAADVLITKAGPGTISEALNAGLPIIMYSYLPGQETGNISFVVSNNAGVWAPNTQHIIQTLQRWIEHPEEYKRIAAACRKAARPDAARQIARIIANNVGIHH